MAQNWGASQFGAPPFQTLMSSGSYAGQTANSSSSPAGPAAQNYPAFQQNTQIPSIPTLSNADPAHIAALLQQLQEAGYPLPPVPAAPPFLQPPQQYDLQQSPQFIERGGYRDQAQIQQDNIEEMGRAASEEGEVSADGDDEEDSSEYDPAKPSFISPVNASRQDETRRRLSDAQRYDRYNGGSQQLSQSSHRHAAQQSNTSSSQNDSRAATPRDFYRRYSPSVPQQSFSNTGMFDSRHTTTQNSRNGTFSNLGTTQPPAVTTGANQLIGKIIEDIGPSSASEKVSKAFAEQADAARKFVSLLSFYGFEFQNLINEKLYFNQSNDWDNLAKLYGDLNLKVPTRQNLHQANGTMGQAKSHLISDLEHRQSGGQPATQVPPSALQTRHSPTLPPQTRPVLPSGETRPSQAEVLKGSNSVRNGQSQANLVLPSEKPTNTGALATAKPAESRAAYLAKLKAAKMKVGKPTEGGVKSASASATPPIQNEATRLPDVSMQTAAISNDVPQIHESETAEDLAARAQAETEVRKRRQNELLQKRLAALRAKQGNATPSKPTVVPFQPIQSSTILQVPGQSSPLTPLELSDSTAEGIPGLAIAGTPTALSTFEPSASLIANSTQAMDGTQQSGTRKRPVATDFEDFVAAPPRPMKQARSYSDDQQDSYESMVIEVSDDDADSEDGGIGIEDDVTSFIRSTANAMDTQQIPKSSTARAPGLLTDFPAQGFPSTASSGQGTPGIVSTPGTTELDLKIAEMKAKIAAREALKRRKLQGSRPETPQRLFEPSNVPSNLGQTLLPSATATGFDAPQVPSASTATATGPQEVRGVATFTADRPISSAGRSESPIEHRIRRQADMKSIDARLASNTSRMELLRREMAQLEAENQRELQEKESLQQELTAFGIDTEGMDKHEMETVRDDIRQQQATQSVPASFESFSQPKALVDLGGQIEPVASAMDFDRPAVPVADESAQQANTQPPSNAQPASPEVVLTGSGAEIVASNQVDKTAQVAHAENENTMSADAMSVESRQEDVVSDTDDEELYATGPAELQKQSPSLTADNDDFEMSDDEEEGAPMNSESPEAAANTVIAVEDSNQSVAEHQSRAVTSVSHVQPPNEHEQINGHSSAQMNNLASEEVESSRSSREDDEDDDNDFYEPDPANADDSAEERGLHTIGQDGTATTSHDDLTDSDLSGNESELDDRVQDVSTQSALTHDVPEAEDEDYEPTDALSSKVASKQASINVPSEVGEENPQLAQAEAESTGSSGSPVSGSSHSSDADDDAMQTDDAAAEPVTGDVNTTTQTATALTGTIASESMLQLQPNTESLQVAGADPNQSQYLPYQSPLRMFKDYRYHPEYSSDVQGGYRSMTYSHQIDANRPLCPYEADGGICNDPDCQGQHFRGMQLSGAFPEP